jgi:hypothetical protein
MGLYQILTDPQNFKFYAEKSFPNVNAVSNATSFGQKSIGYGDTNQPYIQIAAPPVVGPTTGTGLQKLEDNIRYNSQSWGPDILNRGNLFGAVRTVDDVTRLTKYFFDKRSISGYLFIAKQNLLSRMSPSTEASTGAAYGLGNFNAGVYTPASTIGQAALSIIEGHLFKQGIDPTGLINSLSIKTYQQAIYKNQLEGDEKGATTFEKNNRLIKLSKLSYSTDSEVNELNSLLKSPYKVKSKDSFFMSYGGGPDSVLGIGPTRIKYATDNTGKKSLVTISTQKEMIGNYLTWDRKKLADQTIPSVNQTPTISEDFRKPLVDDPKNESLQTFLSISPSYKPNVANTGNIETRTNFRGAGERGNRKNYQVGKIITGRVAGPVDLINAVPIYQGATPSNNDLLKDMIDFRIGIYDNNTIGQFVDKKQQPIKLNWMHFRVLLDEYSDSYGADWKAISYMGRAENFYKYDSFKRDISIGFTVAAQSKQELLPIYKKLNYLASSLAPSYSDNGFIRGNLSQITLGDWLLEQPGFISSVDLSIPDDSPWEINLPVDGNKNNLDPNVKQVPHMVNVKIKFTPIHRFRPEIMKLSNTPSTETINGVKDPLNYPSPTYGSQRFIALQNSKGDDGYNQPNQTTTEQENLSAAQSTQQQGQLTYSPDQGQWNTPESDPASQYMRQSLTLNR